MSSKNSAHDDGDVERVERDGSDHSYTVHKIHQNGRDIFYTTIPVDDLFPYTFVERFCENPEEGYQRRFDKRRAAEIAEYLATDGMSIPINVVLSAQPNAVFDEVVRKAKKELNSVKLPALQTVVSLFSDISEANYTGAAKRQRLVEEMRNRLHSDVRIDADDI